MKATLVSGAPNSGTIGTTNTQAVVDASFNAVRMSPKPYEFNSPSGPGGFYRLAVESVGATVIASGGTIFSVRAPMSGLQFILQRFLISAVVTTAFSAAQALDYQIIRVDGFTAADTGGTTVAPLLTSNRMRTNMASSSASSIQVSTTAALGAGTGTSQSRAIGMGVVSQNNAVGSGGGMVTLFDNSQNGAHPAIFGPNEGFRVSPVTTMGSTGVVNIYYVMEWLEALF